MPRLSVPVCVGSLVLLLVSGCTSQYGFNRMIPEGREHTADEVATLMVAAPLRVDSVDGTRVENLGEDRTVIELLPGEHTVVSHVYQRTDSLYTDYYETFRSEPIQNRFTARPGWLYTLRVVHDVHQNLEVIRTEVNGGPHPFESPNGYTITIQPEEDTVVVERGGELREYDLRPDDIYYSWDARHLAFLAHTDQYMIVRDGVEGTPFKSSEAIPRVWSWDSQHFAHVIRDDRGVTVLVDERPMGPYQAMLIGAEVFFDLDNRLIYAAQKQDRWCMMRDEEVLMAGTKGDVRVAVEENLDAVVNALMSRKK